MKGYKEYCERQSVHSTVSMQGKSDLAHKDRHQNAIWVSLCAKHMMTHLTNINTSSRGKIGLARDT